MPDVSPELAAIIDRALAYEQDDRWPDAAAMQSALRRVLGVPVADDDAPVSLDMAPTIRPPSPPPWSSPRSSSSAALPGRRASPAAAFSGLLAHRARPAPAPAPAHRQRGHGKPGDDWP